MQEMAELHRVFNMFDSNQDGSISLQELLDINKKLGMKRSEEELAKMLKSVDANEDGQVDFKEFLSLYSQHLGMAQTENHKEVPNEDEELLEELQEAFSIFDKNHDGFITPNELHCVLNRLGLKNGTSINDVKNMIRCVDTDGDGKVNFDEFKLMMSKTLDNTVNTNHM